MEISELILKIIENPFAKKGYRELKNKLLEDNRPEAEAFDYLIQERFDRSHSGKKSPEGS